MKRKKDEDKGREKEPTTVPSDHKDSPSLPEHAYMRGNNNRNGNGKETGMENQRGKDTGMQDNPTIPTLSDQKKPPFPTERKAHPQTTRKKEEQTFSLLPKGESLPSPSGNDFSLSLLLKKNQLPKSKKTPLPLAKNRASFSLLPKELPSLPQKTTTSLSPPLKTKQRPDDKPIHTLPRHDRGA